MNQTTKQITLVKSKITKRSWLVNARGRRITPKFKIVNEYREGEFVELTTKYLTIIYHEQVPEVLSIKQAGGVSLHRLTDKLYKLVCWKNDECEEYLYTSCGKRLYDCSFQCIATLAPDVVGFESCDKWGLMDESGNIIVDTARDWRGITEFNKFGYAKVTLERWNKYAVINKLGVYMFAPIDCTALDFLTEELILVTRNRKYGVINIKGEEVVPAIYNNIKMVGDYFIVKIQKYGLLDKAGKVLLECIYDEVIETPDKFVVRDFAKLEVEKVKEVFKQ